MSSIKSKVYFIVLIALFVSFTPFLTQDAFALAPTIAAASTTTTTTTVTITFSESIFSNDGATGYAQCFRVDGQTPTGDATLVDNTGAGDGAVVLTVATALATDATPTVTYTAANCVGGTTSIQADSDSAVMADDAGSTMLDGVVPVFSSATTSSTTIDITFSESITNDSAIAGDFAIAGVATNPTVTAISGSPGTTLTLTLNAEISDNEGPTVSYTRNARVIDDGATGNILATFGAQTVTVDDENVVKTGGGSSGNKHNTKPTFGLDPKSNFQLIDDGFSFNGVPTDISDNHWTPYEQQNIKLGELNEFETKVFASQKLRVQEFLFGIPIVGEAHKAELGIEVHYDHSGKIEEIIVIQKTDVIDIDSVQIEKIKSKCKADSSDERCVTTQLQMKFLEPLQDNVMAMKAIDFKGRSQITYLNDGFDISGDSLNPMKTMMIIGTEKYEGLIAVTQTAKYSDVWVAQDGRAFEMNEYYTPKLINQSIQDKIDTRNNLDRYHSEFTLYKQKQIDKAQKLLKILCEHCSDESFDKINDIFAYDFPEELDRLDNPKVIQKMLLENERSQKIMNYLLDPILKYK